MTADIEKIRDALAYEAAKSDLECFCDPVLSEGKVEWYDTKDVDPDFEEPIARAIVYLTSLNMILRNPDRPALVRVKDAQ